MSVSLVNSSPSIFIFFHSSALSKGLPLEFKFIFSGSFTGSLFLGIGKTLPSLSYAIGIGHPQYLCLDTPQSFNLKFIFFLPNFFFSSMSMVLIIDSSGTFNPSK